MKIFAISDLHLSIASNKPMDIFGGNWHGYLEKIEHSWNELVSEDDLVLLAGDLSWGMTLEEAKPDIEFLKRFKGKKIIIRGNHDGFWWKSISNVRNALPYGTYALQNDAMRIGNVTIAGSRGWQTPEKEWTAENTDDKKIYDRELIRMEMSLQHMQKIKQEGDLLIAMIHYPPYNTRMHESPFTLLFEKYGVHKVVYGHLHGKSVRPFFHEKNGIQYYLTSCDKLGNKLALIRGE
ncbi:MAG: metallophosphoesterase [Firmicutes bacterium]|nr:metallophosphoesterase [Bacillota bacterium]